MNYQSWATVIVVVSQTSPVLLTIKEKGELGGRSLMGNKSTPTSKLLDTPPYVELTQLGWKQQIHRELETQTDTRVTVRSYVVMEY